MASILKIDVLQERYANTGILLSGQINGPLGEIITREGRLKLPNEFAANSLNIANAFAANTITANLYSGITLNMIENVAATANANQVLTADGSGNFFFADAATELKELTDVNSTATANQVLTADGSGNFFFADAATELKELTDVNSTATANQVLTADGTGNFFFADAATELKELTDVNSTATANQVLTADGTGSFFFAAASDPITVQKTNTTNAILSTVTNVNDFRFDSDSGFDVVDLGSGAVKIQMNSTFKTWKVDGQEDLIATGLDTIQLVAGNAIELTTNANSTPYKTISFSVNSDDLIISQYIQEFYQFTSSGEINYTFNSEPLKSSYKVDIYLNGLRLLIDDDYTINHANNLITFANAFQINDKLSIDVFTKPTSYFTYKEVAVGGELSITYPFTIDSNYISGIYQNGLRLPQELYTVDLLNDKVDFVNSLSANDVVEFDFYKINLIYDNETFAIANSQNSVTLTNNIVENENYLNVYVNGVRFSTNEYSVDYSNNEIIFDYNLNANTVVTVDILEETSIFKFAQFANPVLSETQLNSTTTIDGTLNVNADTNITGNTSISGDSFTIDSNTNVVIEGTATLKNITANNITANTYSGIYLNMLENVNATANTDQVLTADGAGNFYFANAATELKELTDVNSTATANQVLVADGVGGFSFQTPTKYIGDNQKEYTANELILAGNTVGLRNDSKIESIYFETVNYPNSVGTANTFISGIINPLSTTFDSNINKNIISFYTSGVHQIVVASATVDNQISFGTPVAYGYSGISSLDLVFDDNANKTVMIYQVSTTGYASVITAYDSNNSVTFGSASAFSSNAGPMKAAFDSNSNKVLIAYRNPTSGLNIGDAIVGTVSGSTISFGTANTFTTNSITRVSATFDSNSNKVVISYNDSTDGNKQKAVVATINGTDVLFGEPVTYDTVNASVEDSTFDPISGKVVIAYRNASQAALLYTVVGTVTGDTITFGSPQRVTTTAPYLYGDYISIDYNSNLNKIIIVGKGNVNQGLVISGTVSGNSIVFDAPAIDFSGTNVANYLTVSHNSNVNRTIISYYDFSTTGGKSAVYSSSYSENITNVDTWIGIAAENIANTATGIVNLPGAIDKNQSGLTKGQTYYLNANGTLSATKTTYALIGKALDSNLIQIFAETSLSKLVDVNSTANANQFLTVDGTGNYNFNDVDYNNLINKPDAQLQAIADDAFVNSIIFG